MHHLFNKRQLISNNSLLRFRDCVAILDLEVLGQKFAVIIYGDEKLKYWSYKLVKLTHPVAITGSEYLETQRTITVPMAILCAARNIHHSPLPHREKLLASKASAGTCRLRAALKIRPPAIVILQNLAGKGCWGAMHGGLMVPHIWLVSILSGWYLIGIQIESYQHAEQLTFSRKYTMKRKRFLHIWQEMSSVDIIHLDIITLWIANV